MWPTGSVETWIEISIYSLHDMTEEDVSGPNPEQLLRLKDELFERWKQLPPEHQATMALVLFGKVAYGAYGPWLQSAVESLWPDREQSLDQLLPVSPITHSHLEQANLTEEEIQQLDEEDLRSISHDIVRHYTNDVFWEELEFLARKTLAEKHRKQS